jgi:hypothetical protein
MKKNIPQVTLIAISSIMIHETIRALQKCCEEMEFGSVKLLSHKKPFFLPSNITFEICPKINNIMDFNHYVFRDFGKHVTTSHCLMVQYHGWVLRPELWDDNWLQYDYIGAPWAYSDDAYMSQAGEHVRVGNGGFSLRSKKLLDLPKERNIQLTHDRGFWNEDGNICVYHREKFLEAGIRYAPVEVASVFSFENEVPENKGVLTFGFHRNKK